MTDIYLCPICEAVIDENFCLKCGTPSREVAEKIDARIEARRGDRAFKRRLDKYMEANDA